TPRRPPRCPPPPSFLVRGPVRGHQSPYRAGWYAHGHVDAYRMYRSDVGRVLGISCSLKVIARLVGLVPIEVDRERIHELSREVLDAYVASDARRARQLTERRRPGVTRFAHRTGAVPPGLAGVSPPPPTITVTPPP